MSETKPAKLDFDGIGRPRFSEHALDQILQSVLLLLEQTERIASELTMVKAQLLRLKGNHAH